MTGSGLLRAISSRTMLVSSSVLHRMSPTSSRPPSSPRSTMHQSWSGAPRRRTSSRSSASWSPRIGRSVCSSWCTCWTCLMQINKRYAPRFQSRRLFCHFLLVPPCQEPRVRVDRGFEALWRYCRATGFCPFVLAAIGAGPGGVVYASTYPSVKLSCPRTGHELFSLRETVPSIIR